MQGTLMDLSHSLTLNEDALKQIPEQKRPIFVFEWLRFLDKVLIAAQKNDIKDCQGRLVEQLMNLLQDSPGPPTRRLIARCMATLFCVGDTFLLFDTVNKCNDILRNKDDSPSFLPTKLGAIRCVGAMYEKLGRMMGRSYEETVQILVKSLRNAESHLRIEIMNTLEKVCCGMGNAIANMHKEIYKAARHCLTDRVMVVRCSAARCLLEMLNHAAFLYTTELESLATLCFRALDGSNYDVRCSVGRLLGTLIAMTQMPEKQKNLVHNNSKQQSVTKGSCLSLEEALGVLMSGFLRGGNGFLKGTGEIIKGSSGVNREVRVGVTHAYVVFVQMLGGEWLERNMTPLLTHVLELVSNPKAASSHVDAVYSRKCINFTLRSTLGKMLGEKAQASACKEIAAIIKAQMNSIDLSLENAKDCNQETLFGQHLVVCALQEMASLILSLGTTASNLVSDPANNILDVVVSVLVHPCQAARLAAAWCLRCICVAIPSQITPLIDLCIDSIENMRTSPEGISGYSFALAAVLGGVRLSPLGVPHTKGKVIFNTAEELLRSASQNSRLSLNRTQAGWLLIGAIMTLGVPVVKGLLPRMLLLWRNSFPRSNKELESEKARGDAFTWQVTLEGRAGALSAMHSFLQNCPDLVTDEISKRILTPVESALAMLTSISSILKTYGQHLKAPAAMVRLRLYETLTLLPPGIFENSLTHLLRLLVSEFTLSENPANTTTSLLRTACHADDSVILGSWLQETDHRTIEDQLQPNSAAGSGALEHDSCCLYRAVGSDEVVPGPLPLGVAVIDCSVVLFGCIFPRIANKHKVQMLDHFSESIKATKSSRAEALTLNVLAALLAGLKGTTEVKASLGQDDVKKSAISLILNALTSTSPMLRCAAGECLGRLAQVIADPRTTAELAQNSFDRLKSARDVVSRTGHSLALGCMHRYVGGLGSAQHLNTSVSVLLALSQDSTSPIVQVWSLHALFLIADSGGPMFRGYVEPTLSLALKLLLTVPHSHVDVHQCIGKVLGAVITTVGPELQGNTSSVCSMRSSLLCACAIMQDHRDPLVQAEATSCLQQLHLFAPRHVNLSSLVPNLCMNLSSNHLLLRKAAVCCLRQLTQREAKEVCEHALTLAMECKESGNPVEGLLITESGLPGALFAMLDTETDPSLIKHIHDTLTSMLQVLAVDNLTQWLSLSKAVLTVQIESISNLESDGSSRLNGNIGGFQEDDDDEETDDSEELKTGQKGSLTRTAVQPRWPTRVFSVECIRKIIAACRLGHSRHFNLPLAKELNSNGVNNSLVLHLSDLVRMAFMAATSDCDQLRLEGLATLHEIIEAFANVPEPEFPGHLLLEQYQAQVGAALRPAFSTDTAPHVTAAACQVCSAWIASGVAKDLSDLRRVEQLLVSSLTKLQRSNGTRLLYNESLLTLERLAILKAWAEVYIVAMVGNNPAGNNINIDDVVSAETQIKVNTYINSTTSNEDEENEDFGDFESGGESLLALVQPEISNLSQAWLAALKDHALLSLPPEFASQLPHDGGAFYTMDTMDSCRPHYAASWPPLLHAASLWLNATQFKGENVHDRFHLLFGVCMEALCSPRMVEPIESIITCLHALSTLLQTEMPRQLLMSGKTLGIELCNVLHRLLLTRENLEAQQLVMDILGLVIKAALEDLETQRKNKLAESTDMTGEDSENLGEGGADGNDLEPGKSLVFAVLEVCLCLLVHQIPALNPSVNSTMQASSQPQFFAGLSEAKLQLVNKALDSMGKLPDLCSPLGAANILPTVLYLTTGVLKEVGCRPFAVSTGELSGVLHCLRAVCCHPYSLNTKTSSQWKALLQSTLAKIIDLAKTGNDIKGEEIRLDEVTMMMSIAVFVLHAPPEVVSAPNLQYPCINHFRRCLQSENMNVKLKSVQTLRTIFANTERTVCTSYIHALAPRLLDLLHTKAAKQPYSEAELKLTLETILATEALVHLAEPKHRIQMLKMLVPELVDCLLEGPSLKEANKYCKYLHDQSLSWLMKIGPQFPQEFKTIVSESADLRSRLETAIRRSQETGPNQKIQSNMQQLTNNNEMANHLQQPTIKLKTDFRNFTS
ncbi:HEAT repeat-containing protein 5B isoform X1 [Cimex lectularius]|uniref:HEAT repeat-containing protein 5A n=1 Tax=Cimex lectularius TaxID=79782 RepID=A0A8I6RME7_CIMLE|nr:HEAT repeat-containing protein 5B isoform X1 [Cimex lectularius]